MRHHRCAVGAHIVFIGTTGLPSMVMRGQMMDSIINQTFAAHGATSSYILVNTPTNTSAKVSAMMEDHFDQVGGPSACVILKYAVAWIGAACRRRGAFVLVDNIDNHRTYSHAMLNNEHYRAADAIIVQTEEHAEMVASWGHTSVVLPHPHGNLGGWSTTDFVRPRIRGVGFVVQDGKNYPTREDMDQIMIGCCRANVTLYMVSSKVGAGLVIKTMEQQRGRSCSSLLDSAALDATTDRRSRPSPSPPNSSSSASCPWRPGGWMSPAAAAAVRTAEESWFNRSWGGNVLPLVDTTHQRRYYHAPQLLDLIDVGLVWRPGHQQGSKISVNKRPPTRLHWWWSHGIPTIGYPMNAYIDAARRAQYPVDLLNLTTADDIERALHQMESQDERSCLQLAAKRGGCLSSPWYAGLELLAAICSAGRACGLPLRPVTTDVVELPATTTRIKGLCGSSSVVSPVGADLVKLAAGSGTGPNAATRRGAPTTMRTRVMTATAEPVPKPSYKYTAPPLVKLQTGTEPSETLSLNAGIFDFPTVPLQRSRAE